MRDDYGRPWLNIEKSANHYANEDLMRELKKPGASKGKAIRIATKFLSADSSDLRIDDFGKGQKVMISFKNENLEELAKVLRSAGFRVKLSKTKKSVTVIFQSKS